MTGCLPSSRSLAINRHVTHCRRWMVIADGDAYRLRKISKIRLKNCTSVIPIVT